MSSRRRTVFFTDGGVPATGLTPTFSTWLDFTGASPGVSAPGVTEVGGGVYYYDVPAGLAVDAVAVLDGGGSLADADRYKADTILLGSVGLGPAVVWSPLQQTRSWTDPEGEGDITCSLYLYVTDRSGQPVTGLVTSDISSVRGEVLEEQSNVSQVDFSSSATLQEVGSSHFPGLYRIAITGSDLKAKHYVTLFVKFDSDSTRTFVVPAWLGASPSSGGGEGNDVVGQFLTVIALILSYLEGVNTAVDWTAFNASGQPTSGTMKLYQDAAAAISRDPTKLISAIDLSYSYDGSGRQSGQVKSMTADAFLAFVTYLGSLAA